MDAVDKILPALLAARDEFMPVREDSTNPHFKSRYASLKSILDSCQGPLTKHGISVLNIVRPLVGVGTTGTVSVGREMACVLKHTSGQEIVSTIDLPPVLKPQEFGSTLTYYRRYLLASLLSLATEDDDGEAAMPRRPAEARVEERYMPPPTRDLVASPRSGNHQPPATGQVWASWIAGECRRVNDDWRAEMAIQNVSEAGRKDFNELINQHQVTNHICTKAIEKGIVLAESVQNAGVRDRAKASKAVADLFTNKPTAVRATVQKYVTEKLKEARESLKLPGIAEDAVSE